MSDTPPNARVVRNLSMLLAALVTAFITSCSSLDIDLPKWLDVVLYTIRDASTFVAPIAQLQKNK